MIGNINQLSSYFQHYKLIDLFYKWIHATDSVSLKDIFTFTKQVG